MISRNSFAKKTNCLRCHSPYVPDENATPHDYPYCNPCNQASPVKKSAQIVDYDLNKNKLKKRREKNIINNDINIRRQKKIFIVSNVGRKSFVSEA